MKRAACAFIAAMCIAGCSQPANRSNNWNEKSSTFTWGSGRIRLPQGFRWHMAASDTFEGDFFSRSGSIHIHHDIGFYAGAWASKKRSYAFEEQLVRGAKVWIGQQRQPDGSLQFAVTFPDHGCANFYMTTRNPSDISYLRNLANSFQPLNEAHPLCPHPDR